MGEFDYEIVDYGHNSNNSYHLNNVMNYHFQLKDDRATKIIRCISFLEKDK